MGSIAVAMGVAGIPAIVDTVNGVGSAVPKYSAFGSGCYVQAVSGIGSVTSKYVVTGIGVYIPAVNGMGSIRITSYNVCYTKLLRSNDFNLCDVHELMDPVSE